MKGSQMTQCYRHFPRVSLGVLLICFGFFHVTLGHTGAQASTDTGTRADAIKKHIALSREASALLKNIAALRAAELKKMQSDIEAVIREWEDDDAEMDGASLRVQLRKALVVAESRNLPVARLSEMFDIARRAILRADYASLCGGGEEISDTLTRIAKSAEEVVTGESADHYFLLSDRVEGRMACEQKKRLEAFKGAWRHYLRALITPSPREASQSIRRLADVTIQLNASEAAVLAADAKVLTARLGQVETILEMVPMVSDAFDVVNAWNGENLTGEQLSSLEQGFIWVNLIAPDALPMAIGYGAKGLGKAALLGGKISAKSIAFLWKLAVPDPVTEALVQQTGRNLDALARRASAILEWARGRYPGGVDTAARLAGRSADTIRDISRSIKDNLPGMTFEPVDVARLNSDMPPEWITALSNAAKTTDTVLITRPVNKHSKAMYKARIAAPKPKTIQAKTSELPGIAGFIPTDQGFSKARREGLGAVERKNRQVAEALARGDAVSRPIRAVDGRSVHTAVDNTGKHLVLKKTGDGGYINVMTGKKVTRPGALSDIRPMEALCDPHTGKYYTGDLDMLGVGSKQQSGWTYGKGIGAVDRPGTPYDPNLPRTADGGIDEIRRMDDAYAGQSGYDEIHGAIQGHEQTVHGQINIHARLEAKKSGLDEFSIALHGGAGRFTDIPETSGLTIVLPDQTVGVINSHQDLVKVFKVCKEKGYKGLEWNPAWGKEPNI